MAKRWSKYEKEFVQENYGKLSGSVMAEKLGRSKAAVYQLAERLNKPPQHRADAWTTDEDTLLRSRYEDDGAVAVALVIGRTAIGVRHRARRLGLSVNKLKEFARNKAAQAERARNRPPLDLVEWRKRVKERDDFTCQSCNLREPPIVTAHHIIPIHKGGQKLSIDNGQTLCPNCHARVHFADRIASGNRVPAETVEQIITMHRQGHSINAIAKTVVHNKKTVARIVRDSEHHQVKWK